MSAIPLPLRQAILEYCASVPGPEIARHAAYQSARYRAGGASQITETAEIAAYLTTRLPATFAAIKAALEHVRDRLPHFKPVSMLDFGAGPGTACWAATEIWPGIQSLTMTDRSESFLASARVLAGGSDRPALQNVQIENSRSLRDDELYDLVVAGYVFSELSKSAIDDVTSRIWDRCRGILVIVEPGTPNGYQRIISSRQALIKRRAVIAAPCASNESCPLESPDWCHFAVRLPRSRDHMRAKEARVPYEDEKYSFVAAARDSVPLTHCAPRIIAPVTATKAGLRFRLCTGHGISEETIPRRDRAAYRLHTRKKWGDAI